MCQSKVFQSIKNNIIANFEQFNDEKKFLIENVFIFFAFPLGFLFSLKALKMFPDHSTTAYITYFAKKKLVFGFDAFAEIL